MTIKAYAVKHKLSIFNVIKMIKSGKLKTESIEENGKEITYILVDENKELKEKNLSISKSSEVSLKEMVEQLQKEVKLLRREVDALKKSYNREIPL